MTSNIIFHENQVFEKIEYVVEKLRDREFYKYEFIGCNFTESDIYVYILN